MPGIGIGLGLWRGRRGGARGPLVYSFAASSLALPAGRTFSRASTASAFTGGSGYANRTLQSAASDVAQFEWKTGDKRRLVLRGSRTNSITNNSTQLAIWTGDNASVVGSGPTGVFGNALGLITENTSLGIHGTFLTSAITVSSGATIAISGTIAAGTRRYVVLGIGNSTNRFGVLVDTVSWTIAQFTQGTSTYTAGGIESAGSGLYRIWVVGALAGVTSYFPIVYASNSASPVGLPNFTGTSSTIQFGDAQFENGNSFPSSPVLTSGSAVSRSAEICEAAFAGALPSVDLSMRVETAAGIGSTQQTYYQCHDGTADNSHRFYRNTSRHGIWERYVGGVLQGSCDVGVLADSTAYDLRLISKGSKLTAKLGTNAVVDGSGGTFPPSQLIDIWGNDLDYAKPGFCSIETLTLRN
jgi:hypothetical protein